MEIETNPYGVFTEIESIVKQKKLMAVYEAARSYLAMGGNNREELCACMDGYCTACRLRDTVDEAKSTEKQNQMSKLEALEKQRDDAIAEIKRIRERGKIEALDIKITKEYGEPNWLRFTDWQKVNKLKALILELLEDEDE